MRKILSMIFVLCFSSTVLAGSHKMSEKKDIVDTAAGIDMFSTLVAAVKAADLVDTLKSDGPFTVFAPTNEAFAALPAGTVDMLLKQKTKISWLRYLLITW